MDEHTSSSNQRNVHITGDARENVIVTGDGNTVIIHQDVRRIREPEGWRLKHRYALAAHFTGRAAEQAMLSQWLEEDEAHPLLILRALGGFGKSALTWVWLLTRVNRDKWTKVVWWSFYEGDASFENFLADTLTYLLGEEAPLPVSPREQTERLLQELEHEGILLVLDGFERALRAYSGLNAAYQGDAEGKDFPARERECVSPAADDFLRGLAASAPLLRAKVLMTTRLRPRAVEKHGSLLAGVREEELTALSKADAVAFFCARGIRGARAEIEAACAPYGYHPLSLRILAGYLVHDRRAPGDIVAAQRVRVTEDLVQNKHHILEIAYDSLSEAEKKVLGLLACFRSAVGYETIERVFAEDEGAGGSQTHPYAKGLDEILSALEARGLLQWDPRANAYDLHPIVRRYAYDRLTAPERQSAHARLRDYFAAAPRPRKIESLDDLAPVIELYHHMVRAGQFDEAKDLLAQRLIPTPLFYQFGAYQLMIELLGVLFPDGEDKPPKLKNESAQAWTLNALANAYALNGEPRRAIPVFENAYRLAEKMGNKANLAIGLGNAAMQQLVVGALAAAEANLRRSIALCREIEDEFLEAVGHQELGRLLAYRGAWAESEQELDAAIAIKTWKENPQGHGVNWAYRALRSLLMAREEHSAFCIHHSALALEAARRALEFAEETARTRMEVPRDFIRAHWLIGAAHRALASAGSAADENRTHLEGAEAHLSQALRRCRANNTVEAEAEILLDISKLRFLQGRREEAFRLAQEALTITERSGYVLQGADVHLWLAELALAESRVEPARAHAEKAKALAWCDGPPHQYRVAYQEAERLLRRLRLH